MSRETNSKLVTGEPYTPFVGFQVTGFPVHTMNLNGLHPDSMTVATLLTPEGARVRALVRVIDIVGVKVRDFTRASDNMLWKIAERDMAGLGARAMAELAYRENTLNREVERAQADRVAQSRRDADALMGR